METDHGNEHKRVGEEEQLFSSSKPLSCRKPGFIVIRLADFPVESEIFLDGDFNL